MHETINYRLLRSYHRFKNFTMRAYLRNQSENLVYLALWLVAFMAPIISLYVHNTLDEQQPFEWDEALFVCRIYALYFVIFCVHNFLLAPLLVYKNKKTHYFVIVVAIVALFFFYQKLSRPAEDIFDLGDPPPTEQPAHAQPPAPPPHQRPGHRQKPPVLVGEHDFVRTTMLVLIFGMNLGIKLYFKSYRDREQMEQLEQENLRQQLAFLKYQISPHFFMNTLNNIHALVDIDPERAQESIVVLSKLMRYLLYESNQDMVPLAKEIAFTNNYIALMRMRFSDVVQINVQIPHTDGLSTPDGEVPPLLLITFIENAFKHGISYQQESRINILLTTNQQELHFFCENTNNHAANIEQQGGVGLDNIRKRLNIIYQENYRLLIKENEQLYTVQLTVPLHPIA